MSAALPAYAQVLPGAVTPGRDDRTGPETVPPPQPDFDFSIVSTHRSPVPRAVDEVRFKVKEVRIVGANHLRLHDFAILQSSPTGNGVYSVKPELAGKMFSLADLLNVADEIERDYREQGYLLVRAYVPPQRVNDGIFTINVVEGHIGNVTVQGGDSRTRDYVRNYLRRTRIEKPLTTSTIERGLLLSNDIPGVAATGVLRPSPDTPGASDLVVDIAQPPVTGGLAVDNRGSRFSGIWTVAGDVEFNSIFGADQLAASVTVSPSSFEQVAGSVRYRTLIGNGGLIGSLNASITHGEPGSTLSFADILTDSYAVGPRLTLPLIRSRSETLLLDGGFTFQQADIFAGSPSVKISHDQWRVLDIGGSYQSNGIFGTSGIWTLTFDVAQGLPILGATHNGDLFASRVGAQFDFTKVALFSRLGLPLGGNFSALFSAQGQYSFSRLITGEQIAFGGNQIGRGYDPGAITGDHGLGGSAELRYDWRFQDSFVKAIQPYLYFDAAQTWYRFDPTGTLKDQNIDSVGGGIRFWLPYDITGAIEGSQMLHAVPGSDAGGKATKVLLDLAVRF
ncbi:MAG: ShlB/FhaC/HecB family hemolysin secretion/activation protein [Proteobacteria bacterium]|nr:ShlB/FhaC/HecB family hemolysin secretion/activation protein [Pseudomonadota bacterium]